MEPLVKEVGDILDYFNISEWKCDTYITGVLVSLGSKSDPHFSPKNIFWVDNNRLETVRNDITRWVSNQDILDASKLMKDTNLSLFNKLWADYSLDTWEKEIGIN